jgi:hypothetical protein
MGGDEAKPLDDDDLKAPPSRSLPDVELHRNFYLK